jgi:membrane fusion protein (multidrug efflux system)
VVEIGKAQAVRLVDDVQAVGSLRARQSVTLRPEVSGRVARLGFADGQRVRRGQLLLQLDDTLQQAQLKQAQAQASIARTNLQRSRELQGQGFVSQSAVDQNLSALEVAEAQVALAQAQLARLKVLAPFDGIVGIRQVNVGDYLKDGAEIVSIDDLAMMLVDFRLPERYMPRVKVGLEVEVNVDAWPEKPFKGRIDALDSQVDANGRSLLIRARVENPGAQLKGGMFARPRVVLGVRENAVVIPEEALVPLGAKQFLFKLVDGEGGQKVARRIEAQIGLRQPGRVEIVGGLVAGDSVVTAGQARLRGESTPVRVIDLSQGPRPPGAAGGAPQAASASGGSTAKSSASSPQRAASVASAGAPPAARANGSAP